MKKAEMKPEVAAIIAELNKKYKKNVITQGMKSTQKVSTGMITLDKLTQGGFPIGRWTMLFGDKGTCKTSLCKQMAGEMVKAGKMVVIVDAEGTWSPEYAKTLGLDTNKLIVNKPDSLEEGITIIQKFAPIADLIIYDSIIAVAPIAEIERDIEQETRALIPRKLSQFFRITTPIIGKSNAVVILVNQVRVDLNKYGMKSYPGGNALGHYCSFILQLWRGSKADSPKKKVNGKEIESGFKIFAKVTKTKISDTEGQTVSFNYQYKGEHFNKEDEIMQLAELGSLIERIGGWYKIGNEKFQGREAVMQYLKENPKVAKDLKTKILSADICSKEIEKEDI